MILPLALALVLTPIAGATPPHALDRLARAGPDQPAAAQPAAEPQRPEPARLEPPAMRHGAQPNPQEVRPGSPQGDAPSAAVGTLVREQEERRFLGLPVNAVLVIAGVLVAVLALAGIALPRARRRHRARGGGTYGR
jgi:uncharacterized iron-regulated membrane protein